MKNTLLITKFFPPDIGGIQSYLYNLVLGLEKEKIFIMTDRTDSRKAVITSNNALTGVTPFKIYRCNFNSPWRFFHLTTFDLFFKAKRIIKAQKIEKILCGHLPIAGPLAFLIKKTFCLPYCVFTHGLEIFSIKNLSAQKQKMFGRVLNEAEKVITTTDFMAGYLEREFKIPQSKIVKIPPGVDVNKFKAQSSKLKVTIQNLKLENYKIILTCGRLVARKNHLSVIRAIAQIIKEIPNVLYIIAGTGPEEKNLRDETKKLHLENYVKFLGEVADNDLPKIYNSANIFVMPTREIPEKGDIEGFGVVFLEAAACGLPCIAGNSGGQVEAIEPKKTGFLVNPESESEITSAILRLLKNPTLAQQMGEAGKTRVIEKFTWQKQVEKLKKILN